MLMDDCSPIIVTTCPQAKRSMELSIMWKSDNEEAKEMLQKIIETQETQGEALKDLKLRFDATGIAFVLLVSIFSILGNATKVVEFFGMVSK